MSGLQEKSSEDSVGTETETEKRPKALVLFSGGLDSTLAIRLLLVQGVAVEAVSFTTPFSSHDQGFIERFCRETGVKLHKVFLGQEFLNMIVAPKHGYGSQMNPCVDCRIYMLKAAKDLAEKIGADFLATGEVLDERPLSQRKDMLLLIEREADLEGKVLRPLSAQLLPESEPEKTGFVRRKELCGIRGRRRLSQMDLAEKFGIKDYPNPSGGCLLTEPRFAERLREHLKHGGELTILDAELLRIGRHFRVDDLKVLVGRDEEENLKLESFTKRHVLATMEVLGYMGPLTLVIGERDSPSLEKAAAITVRYSDAPKDRTVKVKYKSEADERELETEAAKDEEIGFFRI